MPNKPIPGPVPSNKGNRSRREAEREYAEYKPYVCRFGHKARELL